ncbi:MAG: hypothetical protein R3C26_13485 [Calditrichia bacterium]
MGHAFLCPEFETGARKWQFECDDQIWALPRWSKMFSILVIKAATYTRWMPETDWNIGDLKEFSVSCTPLVHDGVIYFEAGSQVIRIAITR